MTNPTINKLISLLFVFMLSICVASCVIVEEGHTHFHLHGPTASVTSSVTLIFPRDTNEAEQNLLVEAARLQVKEFEFDWGSKVRPVQIYLFRGDSIPCGNLEGKYWGCHYSPKGPIHAIMGEYYEIPVVYHELVHHMIPGNDHNHLDPRWNTMWNIRQAIIIMWIQADRLNLDLNKIKYG